MARQSTETKPKEITTKEGKLTVRRTVLGQESENSETIDVKHFQTHPARVGFHGSQTINTGNYNSIKVGVWVELPCYEEEIADAYKRAKEFVEQRLQAEVAEIEESLHGGNEIE